MTKAVSRRSLRLALVAVGVLLALFVGSLFALPTIVRQVVVWQVSSQTGRAASLDAAEVALFRGRVALKNLRVLDRDAGPLATIERLEIRFRPRDLLRGHLRISDGTLQAPTLRVVRTGPNQFNVSDLFKPGEGKRRLAVTVERFVVRDGVVTVEDRTVTPTRAWRVDGVTVDAHDASTVASRPAGTVALSARVGGAPLAVALQDVRLAPLQLRGTVTARDIDVGLAALALPPQGPLDAPRGALDASVTLEHDATAGSRAAVDVQLRGIELRRAGQAQAFLTAPSIRLTGDDLRARGGAVAVKRVAVDGGTVTLEDSRLGSVKRWQVDGIAFEASNLSSARDAAPGTATARAVFGLAGSRADARPLGAPGVTAAELSIWAGEVRLAPVEAKATVIVRNVDLALARLYLPPELPVQPERGAVNATFRVDHDGTRGTRVALDVALNGIELRRPAHFVTAPAVRVTAEDIAFANGAVTVGRARIDGARLTLEERAARPVRTWDVRDLAVEGRDLSSRRDAVQGVATARVTVAGASVSAWLTKARLDPLEAHATAILRNVDLGLLRLYLPPQTPVDSARGSANASVDLDYTVAEGVRANVDATLTGVDARVRSAQGVLTVATPSLRVTVADARSHGAALSVGRVELSGSGSLVDPRAAASRVDLADLRVVTEQLTWPVRSPASVTVSARFRDRGELEASGTARLTAPLPAIAWQSDLALKFRGVDLAPVGEYVAQARGLGGRVRANVTATLTYAGALTAHVRGDVGGGRFLLTEGGRTLLGLRRIDITGLDAQWPERVSIQHVRLREPFAHIERDRQGTLPLLTRFERRASEALPAAPPPGEPRALPAVTIGELIVENGRATVVDERPTTPARIELPRFDLTARDVTWPAAARPARIVLDAQLPDGGTLRAEGTVSDPATVDLTVAIKRGQIAALQPYFAVPGTVRARFDANVTVRGPLTPVPKLAVKGEADVRRFSIADGARRVLTMERLRITGIDALWPERLSIDTARAERSWALIERDRQGVFTLQRLLTRRPDGAGSRAVATPASPATPAPTTTPAPPATSAPPAAAPALAAGAPLAVSVREVVFEQQGATIVDGVTTPPARMEVTGARLVMRDFRWPTSGTVAIELTSPTPVAGRLAMTGTVRFEPVRIDARATLDGVSVEPAQPYLPIEGRVAGRITGEVGVELALEPLAVRVTGDARLQGFRLNDGDRSLVAVGRLEAGGIDIDWPKRIAMRTVLLRRPRLLVERDAKGEIVLRRIATPRWQTVPTATATATPNGAAPPSVALTPPVIEIATFTIERADARFVDYAVTPSYAEEVSDMQLVVTGFTTAPGRRTQFTGSGGLGGGSFKLTGEGTEGRAALDLKLDLHDVVIPRANAYLEHFTGWTATRGSFSANAVYTLKGTRLDSKHDVVVRGLELAASERDEVERRVGLPFGMLVSLLKDSRGEIKVSLPVSGDIGTREFDFREAVWTAVRNLAVRLLAAPFARVGSLFVSQDSRVQAVAVKPVAFESGAARLAAGMDTHLEQVGGFLRATPAIKVELDSIFTQGDVDALKSEQVRKRLPDGDALATAQRAFRERWPDRQPPTALDAIVAALAAAEPSPAAALRALGTQRLEVVRQALTRGGGVEAERLAGTVPRSPLIEAGGTPRVELDLKY